MPLNRRDLVTASVLAFGATAFIGTARADVADEAAVKQAVEDMRAAYLKQDKAKLDAMTSPQLTYSHSDGRIQDKGQFIAGVMDRKGTVKSLEYPELKIYVSANTGIARHLWVSDTEVDGKVTNTKIGVMQVWQKQGDGWKLLARSSYKLPDKA